MKNLLYYFLFFSTILNAQENCVGEGAAQMFHVNNIGASFSPQGIKFLPLEGYFTVPYTSSKAPYTIFASSPWIGGFLDGELGISAQTYGSSSGMDFYTGPLLEGALTIG